MAPIGSPHASKVGHLTQLLFKAVGDRAPVWAQMSLRLGAYSEPQPDLMLVKPKGDFYASGHPGPQDVLLVVEVGDTSLKYDRDTKIPLYARHGIVEVWLVDVEGRRLTIYRQPARDSYRAITDPAALGETPVQALPGISIDLTRLF